MSNVNTNTSFWEGTNLITNITIPQKKFSEAVINILEFLIDNLFVIFDGRVLQQTVGISMGANCAPLLACLFLYSYKAGFIQGFLNENERKISRSIL